MTGVSELSDGCIRIDVHDTASSMATAPTEEMAIEAKVAEDTKLHVSLINDCPAWSERGPHDYVAISSDNHRFRIPAKYLPCDSDIWDNACTIGDSGTMTMNLKDIEVEQASTVHAFLKFAKDGDF